MISHYFFACQKGFNCISRIIYEGQLHFRCHAMLEHGIISIFYVTKKCFSALSGDSLCCLFVQKKDTGQVLLDKVFKHLELVEKDYFGLQFSLAMPNAPDAVVSDALSHLCHAYRVNMFLGWFTNEPTCSQLVYGLDSLYDSWTSQCADSTLQ